MNIDEIKQKIDEEFANTVSEDSIYFHWIQYFRHMQMSNIAKSFLEVFNESISNIEEIVNQNPNLKGVHLLLYYISDGGHIDYWGTNEINKDETYGDYYVNETFELTKTINNRIYPNSNFRFADSFFNLLPEAAVHPDNSVIEDYLKICKYLEDLGYYGLRIGLNMFLENKKLPKGFSFFLQDIDFPEATLLYTFE